MALMADVETTDKLIGIRCTARPVAMLSVMPRRTFGKNRSEAWIADTCCTSWWLKMRLRQQLSSFTAMEH